MRKVSVALVAFVALATTACIHKTGGAVTPWEKVHTYNAALAEANNAAEKGAEAVVTSGFASPQEMAPIINMTGQVAMLHQQITSILASGQATQANIASVKALVDTVKASLQKLPPSSLGIKNPKSQQLFQNDVANIGTLADAVLTALQAVGGGS
jgi:pyruvate/oxaloacetate carboxyltransferase